MRRVFLSLLPALGFLAGAATVGYAQTVNVGINFRHTDYVSAMPSGVSAGAVVSHGYWNSTLNGPASGDGTTLDIATPSADTLVDSMGVDSGLTLVWDYDGTYANWGGTATGTWHMHAGKPEKNYNDYKTPPLNSPHYRYIRYEDGSEELYAHEDPWNVTNLVSRLGMKTVLEKLCGRLDGALAAGRRQG